MVIQMAKTIAEVMSFLFPGLTFDPTDVQLLLDYLKHKILGQLPNGDYLNMLPEVEVLESEPWQLHSRFSHMFSSEKLFFFCRLEPKYQTSSRYNRTTKAGYWKPTGKGRPIKTDTGVRIGEKRILVFHKGRTSQGERTSWVMHEYHLNPKCLEDDRDENEELPYVACWIQNKGRKPMMGHAPDPVNQEGDDSSFAENQHNEVVAAHSGTSVEELMESLPSLQPPDGNLSNHTTNPAYQPQAGAEEGLSSSFHFSQDNNGNEFHYGYIPSPYSNSAFYSGFNISPDYNTTPAYQPQAGAEQGSSSSPGLSRGNDGIGPDFEPLLSPDGNHTFYPNFCPICLRDHFIPTCIYGQS